MTILKNNECADNANKEFGESYGVDWAYESSRIEKVGNYFIQIDEHANINESKYCISKDLSSGIQETSSMSVSDLEACGMISIVAYHPFNTGLNKLELPLLKENVIIQWQKR